MPTDTEGHGDGESAPSGNSHIYDVIVVGAGAAGVGVSIALIHAGVENFLIVDRDTVGASFDSWPAETRFITPSFPSNSIGMLDLNSIAIGVSPAYSMKIEHPTGPEFAQHLRDIAEYFELPLQENTDVKTIEKKEGFFHLETNQGTLFANNVIWSAGEYQYPCTDVFTGSELCRHTATVPSYAELEGDDFLIIGGYESGVDAAYHLSNRNKKVRLFDLNAPWDAATSDPSVALSTYSFERMRNPKFEENTELYPETIVNSVTLTDGIYEVNTEDGQIFQSKVQPLLAAGF
ncbi:MAG: monooxygenase, partial [Euryarchaeota archaeon]|nr:monooxygenase [Euryarchaeota archaeon]